MAANEERSKGWKSAPYFIRDNYVGGNLADGLMHDLKDNITFAGIYKIEMDKTISEQIEANRKEYERLLKDNNYTDVRFNPENEALSAIHKGHKKNNPKEETYYDGLTSIDLEKKCQEILFKNGHRCVLENENIKDANRNLVTTLDSNTNGIAMDIRSATRNVLNYRNMLYEKNDQLEKYNRRSDIVKSNSVILYFHDASFYNRQKVDDGYAAICNILSAKEKINHIKEIICVVSDGRIHHFRY